MPVNVIWTPVAKVPESGAIVTSSIAEPKVGR